MTPTTGLFVLAHNIRSLHNVGSIFRTSDVFAVDKLFLSGYTGHPPDPRLEKVSLGADKTVLWEYHKSAVRIIKKLRLQHPGLTVVGLENNLNVIPAPEPESRLNTLDAGSEPGMMQRLKLLSSLPHFKAKLPLLLVLGEEVSGIPKNVQELCDQFVEIPQFGTKESLNVSVAFGIAVYHIKNAIK